MSMTKMELTWYNGLWYLPSFEVCVRAAAAVFRKKYRQLPTECRVNPRTAGEKPLLLVDGITIILDRSKLVGDFHLSALPKPLEPRPRTTPRQR